MPSNLRECICIVRPTYHQPKIRRRDNYLTKTFGGRSTYAPNTGPYCSVGNVVSTLTCIRISDPQSKSYKTRLSPAWHGSAAARHCTPAMPRHKTQRFGDASFVHHHRENAADKTNRTKRTPKDRVVFFFWLMRIFAWVGCYICMEHKRVYVLYMSVIKINKIASDFRVWIPWRRTAHITLTLLPKRTLPGRRFSSSSWSDVGHNWWLRPNKYTNRIWGCYFFVGSCSFYIQLGHAVRNETMRFDRSWTILTIFYYPSNLSSVYKALSTNIEWHLKKQYIIHFQKS